MDAPEKLTSDLKIIERFVEDVPAYLASNILFYPTGPLYPELTMGGYLMRQHRLLLLQKLLDQDARNRLNYAVAQFQSALSEHIVAFEARCHRELDARLRQWREYLRDLEEDRSVSTYYYTAVEPRVMIEAIVDQLSLPPYQLTSSVPQRVLTLDAALQARWDSTEPFVWPDGFQPAYPNDRYWFLYGAVTRSSEDEDDAYGARF